MCKTERGRNKKTRERKRRKQEKERERAIESVRDKGKERKQREEKERWIYKRIRVKWSQVIHCATLENSVAKGLKVERDQMRMKSKQVRLAGKWAEIKV